MGLVYRPLSMKPTALRRNTSIFLSAGRSSTRVRRPSDPMASGCRTLSSRRIFEISTPQNPKLQCSLKADMLQRMAPLYSKKGRLHLMASTTPGLALCTNSRMCMRIGCGANDAIHAKRLETEHLLDAEPGEHFGSGKHDSESDA